MKRHVVALLEWWRKCTQVQVIEHDRTTVMLLPTFGRAKFMTGAHPIYSEQPPYYMVYWLRLPCFEWRDVWWQPGRFSWHQAVLFLHGRDGFGLRWVPDSER